MIFVEGLTKTIRMGYPKKVLSWRIRYYYGKRLELFSFVGEEKICLKIGFRYCIEPAKEDGFMTGCS